jgi:hypothetical protein
MHNDQISTYNFENPYQSMVTIIFYSGSLFKYQEKAKDHQTLKNERKERDSKEL